MGRPASIVRPRKLTLHLPEDVATRLELHLFSPGEGRIPQGAWQRFLVERINEFFAKLDRKKEGVEDESAIS